MPACEQCQHMFAYHCGIVAWQMTESGPLNIRGPRRVMKPTCTGQRSHEQTDASTPRTNNTRAARSTTGYTHQPHSSLRTAPHPTNHPPRPPPPQAPPAPHVRDATDASDASNGLVRHPRKLLHRVTLMCRRASMNAGLETRAPVAATSATRPQQGVRRHPNRP
jgi:hypothetical protein